MELGVPGAFKSHRFATAARKLKFQPEEIWEVISAPGNLLDCHPFCRSNEPIVWDDMGHSDVLANACALGDRPLRQSHRRLA